MKGHIARISFLFPGRQVHVRPEAVESCVQVLSACKCSAKLRNDEYDLPFPPKPLVFVACSHRGCSTRSTRAGLHGVGSPILSMTRKRWCSNTCLCYNSVYTMIWNVRFVKTNLPLSLSHLHYRTSERICRQNFITEVPAQLGESVSLTM